MYMAFNLVDPHLVNRPACDSITQLAIHALGTLHCFSSISVTGVFTVTASSLPHLM